MKLPAMLALLLVLASCKFDFSSVLPLSQLAPSEPPKSGVLFDAAIAFESSSTDEKTAQVVEVIEKYFPTHGEPEQKSGGMTKNVVIPIKIPLIRETDTPDETSIFVLEERADDQGIEVFLKVNEDRFNLANTDLQALANAAVALKEIEFQFTVTNDRDAPCRLTFSSVYVDGRPIPFSTDLDLNQNQSVVVIPSNVLLDTLNGSTPIPVFRMANEAPPAPAEPAVNRILSDRRGPLERSTRCGVEARIPLFWRRLSRLRSSTYFPVRLWSSLSFDLAKTTGSVASFGAAFAALSGGLGRGSGAGRATSLCRSGFVGDRRVSCQQLRFACCRWFRVSTSRSSLQAGVQGSVAPVLGKLFRRRAHSPVTAPKDATPPQAKRGEPQRAARSCCSEPAGRPHSRSGTLSWRVPCHCL